MYCSTGQKSNVIYESLEIILLDLIYSLFSEKALLEAIYILRLLFPFFQRA